MKTTAFNPIPEFWMPILRLREAARSTCHSLRYYIDYLWRLETFMSLSQELLDFFQCRSNDKKSFSLERRNAVEYSIQLKKGIGGV